MAIASRFGVAITFALAVDDEHRNAEHESQLESSCSETALPQLLAMTRH